MASTNLYIVAVNSFLKYAGFGECVLKTERLQKRQCPENIISREEYSRMLTYAKESGGSKYYCLMRTLALTGLRIGELRDCTVEALERGKFMTSSKGRTRKRSVEHLSGNPDAEAERPAGLRRPDQKGFQRGGQEEAETERGTAG